MYTCRVWKIAHENWSWENLTALLQSVTKLPVTLAERQPNKRDLFVTWLWRHGHSRANDSTRRWCRRLGVCYAVTPLNDSRRLRQAFVLYVLYDFSVIINLEFNARWSPVLPCYYLALVPFGSYRCRIAPSCTLVLRHSSIKSLSAWPIYFIISNRNLDTASWFLACIIVILQCTKPLENLAQHCNIVTRRWRRLWRHQKCRLQTKTDI